MTRNGRRYRVFVLLLLGTLSVLPLVPGGESLSAPFVRTDPLPDPAPGLAAPRIPELAPVYLETAAAVRRRDCDRALARLEPLTAPGAADASFARVVQGLYAHACERVERAQELLGPVGGGGRGTVLEDWRLLTLADSATALGHDALARAALETLLSRDRTSPLYARALEKAARTARDAGDPTRALKLAEGARHLEKSGVGELPHETLRRLDELAWEIGVELGDEGIQRRTARRLLTRDPETADELAVETVFESEDGEIPWAAVLSPAELQARGRALARANRYDEAVEALEAVPPSRRDAEWRLLAASVLTAAHRGDEALRVLTEIELDEDSEGGDRRELAEKDRELASRVEWQRALAARDLATARRGRRNLPSAARDRWRRIARRHLLRVAELDGDRELSIAALRRLFFDLADTELDAALDVLRRLRALDPEDTVGADFLWRRGWQRFERRNYSTAIGYWSELSSLYPGHRDTRSARYWSGRAYEALGHQRRARELYREVAAADTTDFYRKYALERLALERPAPERPGALPPDPAAPPGRSGLRVPSQEPEPWPEDARLARARLLTDLGLDDLALAELEGVRWRSRAATPPLDARAADALESEILHRKGDLRASIGPIRRTFPALGGPYQASVPERALRLYYPLAYGEEIRAQAELYDLPVDVLYGMIRQESGFDPGARSRAGARGLLQLMPTTAREVARRIGLRYSSGRLHDPSFNVHLGAAYFRQVLSMFDDRLDLALAGYNGGPYRIRRLWRRAGHRDVDRFLEGLELAESRIYVKRILVLSDSYRQLYGPSGGSRVAAASPAPAAAAVGR